jgi:phosphoenolpyruvate carboxykinase (GTP)
MGDYFRHWLELGNARPNFPKIFHVNWFRTNDQGKFLWPGFGENLRVLRWIHGRVHGTAAGRESPIGILPAEGAIDTTGLDVSTQAMAELTAVDREAWLAEADDIEGFLKEFGARMPEGIWRQHRALKQRLGG